MTLDWALLAVGAVAVLIALVAYRIANVPRSRRGLSIVATVVVCAIVITVAPASQGWVRAFGITLMSAAALVLTSAWAWKWDSFVARRTGDVFASRPDIQQKFASHPLLKRLMKKPPN